MHVEFRQIEQAIVLARTRNFARAAEILHVSQPALSRSIAALERELGVQLFTRGPRAVVPTAFGELLLERGRQLLDGEQRMRAALREIAGLEFGRVTIAAAPFPTEISVGLAVGRLLVEHPRVRATIAALRPELVPEAVIAGRVEIGIAAAEHAGPSRQVEFLPLPSHTLFLACRPGHPLARASRLTVERIAAFPIAAPIIMLDAAQAARALVHVAPIEMVGADAVPALCVDSLATGRQIAKVSDAVTVGTAGLLEADVQAGTLVRLPFAAPFLRTRYGIMTPRGQTPSPAASAFIAALTAVEEQIAASERAASV
jgi:DNA-binding transcriptional LysR family regulator